MFQAILYALAWCAWCLLHSLLIAGPLSRFLHVLCGRATRVVYNLFALFSVVPLVFWEHYAGSVTIYTWPGTLLPLRLLLLVAAAWLLLAGARVFPLRSFTGWAQLSGDVPDGETETPLVTSGVLARVRHPWYSAALLLLWLRDQHLLSLVSSVVLSLYLVVGAMLEEKRLTERYGDAYRDYRRRVPMFIPRI